MAEKTKETNIHESKLPELREHRRNAHRELLLGWRSMIDNALKRMEDRKKKS